MKRSVLLIALVLAVMGCGSSDKNNVKSAVESYISGLANKNGKEVCDQLAGSVQSLVKERASAKSCAAAIATFENSPTGKAVAPVFKTAKVGDVNVKGGNATAQVSVKVAGKSTPLTIPLEKVNGSWKISSTNTG